MFVSTTKTISVAAFLLLARSVRHAAAVCQQFEMAVAVLTTPADSTGQHATMGALLTNNCGHIDTTEAIYGMPTGAGAPTAACSASYLGRSSVLCGSDGAPKSAVDTQGGDWTCRNTTDSCNMDNVRVLACCAKVQNT